MIAHVRKSDGAAQPLKAHLIQTGKLCAQQAEPLGLKQTAYLLGILHDMGKATEAFKAYLLAAGKDDDAASPHYHAPTGTIFVYRRWFQAAGASAFQRLTAQVLALCIYGHHAGLPDCLDLRGRSDFITAMEQETEPLHYAEAMAWFCGNVAAAAELDALFLKAQAEVTAFFGRIKQAKTRSEREFRTGMTVRMLLGILADADRWDAACFEYGGVPDEAMKTPNWAQLLKTFERFKEENLRDESEIGRIRAAVSAQCFACAENAPGIYTLCVPTGGGKTYSSLRFALRHAALYGKSRVFYIIPYNTILDQNAQDIRAALQNYGSILEHHSNVVTEAETRTAYRKLTERWDSDIILTSLVQFLNACFAAPNTDARRLHRLANAVLIFDEVQSLPKHCKTLFEWVISFLAGCCGATVVLCTATQPRLALDPPPTEMIEDCAELFLKMKRVSYLPQLEPALCYAEAAERLTAILREQSVLMIVNTKTAARRVYAETIERLEDAGLHPVTPSVACGAEEIDRRAKECGENDVLCVHLSTWLCPAHRKKLLRWVKIWLRAGAKVLCVSTALIEAGINVSFPVVVRSLTGLPSIVQAAGRANRSMEYGTGRVYIWHLREENLAALPDIQNGGNITRAMLEGAGGENLDSPEMIERYFVREQDYTRERQNYPYKDGISLCDLLSENRRGAEAGRLFKSNEPLILRQSFRTAYRAFEAIPTETTAVLVPFGVGKQLIEKLCGALSLQEQVVLLRSAQAYSVALYPSDFEKLLCVGGIYEIGDMGVYAMRERYYEGERGVII